MTDDSSSLPGTSGDRVDPGGSEPARERAPWTVATAFGLTAPMPVPVFLVLDAAEEHEFTGAIAFGAPVSARVYFDHGRFVLAERDTDDALADRFVAAGATDAATIEQASVLVGDDRYLGRLFDRAPHIDRIAVLVALDVITESTVADIARALVDQVDVWPYRRHPSGVHRWERTDRVRPRATTAWPAPVLPPPVRSLRAEALVALPAPTLPRPVVAPGPAATEPVAPPSAAPMPAPEPAPAPQPEPEPEPAMALPARRPGATEPPEPETEIDDTDAAGVFRVVWPSGAVELAVPLADEVPVDPAPPVPGTGPAAATAHESEERGGAPSAMVSAPMASATSTTGAAAMGSPALAPPEVAVPEVAVPETAPERDAERRGGRITGAPLFDPDEVAPATGSAFPPPPPASGRPGAEIDDVFRDAPLPIRGSDRARRRRRSWPR